MRNIPKQKAPKLVAKNISKRFGDIEALHQVDITVFPGKVTAFVGPNGAGKTTLFHVISGNLKSDSGIVMLDGQDITGLPPWKIARKHVGKLYQDIRIFEYMSALENIQVALLSENEHWLLSAFWLPGQQKRLKKHIDEAMYYLDYVGLTEDVHKLGGELSFGQQKLLAIARLMAHKSNLLLLDEPTAALSPVMTRKMIDLIQKLLTDRERSVALIEHNMEVVKELAFYIYFMHEGGIYCHGTQHCVLENPEVRELYMGLSGMVAL